MPKIIFFNGPPRSGKDTAAEYVYENLMFWTVGFDRFSMPCKRAFAGTMGVEIDEFGYIGGYEEHKDEVIPVLGVSYRQWQIDYSEKFMKPQYGSTIFADLLVNRNVSPNGEETNDLIVIPDSGFIEEVDPVIDRFGAENTLLVRVHREGCDFSKDSRSYIYSDKIKSRDVVNTDLDVYHENIEQLTKDFMRGAI